jgi:hypothetical protein
MESASRLATQDVSTLHLVVLQVKSESDLLKSMVRVQSWDVSCYPFIESDLNDEHTAFATGIVPGEQRHLFRRWQLWKGPKLPAMVTSALPHPQGEVR